MRLLVLNCLLLASVAMASPNGRQKRDLSYLKNLITSAIFGRQQINIQKPSIVKTETDYKLFRLPGYDDIMVKVSPKKPVVEEYVFPPVEPVNLNAFGSVVGTKSNDDTLVAVKGVDNLLSTGILYEGHNNVMKETIAPMFPSLNNGNYVAAERMEAAPVIEARPPPPVLTEVIKPYVEEKVEFQVPFEPKYSYKQMKNNEAVITYTAHNNPDVEVVETIKMKTELPMCIKKRIDQAIVLGADPYRLGQVQEIYQHQTPPVVDMLYGKVENSLNAQHAFREDRFIERFNGVANFGVLPQRLRALKDSPVHHNVRPMKIQAINPRPVPLHSDKAPHLDVVNITGTKETSNSQNKKVTVFTHSGDKIDIDQTLGPLPPKYIALSSKKDHSAPKQKTVNQMKAVQIVGSKDNVANSKIPSAVYQNQRNPNTGKVLKENNDLRTNLQTNAKHYVIVPNVKSEGPKKSTELVKDGLYTNKVSAKPQTVTRPTVASSTNSPKANILRENKPVPLKENPVPKLKQYSYQQKNTDGSSVNINGNKHGVTVNVKQNNNRGRGDIPDQ